MLRVHRIAVRRPLAPLWGVLPALRRARLLGARRPERSELAFLLDGLYRRRRLRMGLSAVSGIADSVGRREARTGARVAGAHLFRGRAFFTGCRRPTRSPCSASFVAAVWMVIEIGNVRGLVVAAASAVGVALAIAPELVRFLQVGVEGDRSKWALFFDWTQTAQILLHRDPRVPVGAVAAALVVLAIAIAAFHRKDRSSAGQAGDRLCDRDDARSGHEDGRPRVSRGCLPLIVLSTSYYSYVFAPVVLAAFLCVGFRHLRGIKMGAVVGGAGADCAQTDVGQRRRARR